MCEFTKSDVLWQKVTTNRIIQDNSPLKRADQLDWHFPCLFKQMKKGGISGGFFFLKTINNKLKQIATFITTC